MAPHLASELWAGLCQVKNPLSPLLQRGGDVLQQSWPTVDPEYLEVPDFVELSVLINLTACGTVACLCRCPRHRAGATQPDPGEPHRTEAPVSASIQEAILSPRTPLSTSPH
ncbi:probable leucine--tRNA ligase, mitochondrial [Lates japonicus]|uniref:Probable leucine--tRNA ligase, mitochondrial n=1 Tax=Lates japonicus TaxID=270547 RepID=A0AAD3RN35_LATJO|nr:probable leucine--tRNA ligase, mitochondrial [Lates japonicus]